MNSRKRILYSFLALAIFAVGFNFFYLRWARGYLYKQYIDDFDNFHTREIDGTITYLGIAHHIYAFRVNGENKSFIVAQDNDRMDEYNDDFYFFPKLGDSV
jgi:hypothetical protein